MPNLNIPKKILIIGLFVLLFSLLIFTSVFLGSKTTKNTSPEPENNSLINSSGLNTNNRSTEASPTSLLQPTQDSQFVSTNITISLEDALSDKGKFMPQETPVAIVGKEQLYYKDLNYILYLLFPDSFDTLNKPMEELKKLALDEAVNQSTILQMGGQQELVTLTPLIFNSLDKDYQLRAKTVKEIQDKLISGQELISGGAISVWYHNVRMPSIPLDEARTIAQSKIQAVYDTMKTDMTGGMKIQDAFDKACNTLKNDSSLSSIDTSYDRNACVTFTDKPLDEPILVRDYLNQALHKLQSGQVSGILEYPPKKTKTQMSEEYFIYMIMFSRTNSGKGSFDEKLQIQKGNYGVKVQ